MSDRRVLRESGTLTKSGAGTYRVRIINEGEGSTGIYGRDLLERSDSAAAFEGALSFMNHPLDPTQPHLRDVTGIAGRLVGEVAVEEHDGTLGLYSDYKPDPRWADFVAEYADVLGLSIYIGAMGKQNSDGKTVVESFDGSDPYRSVDIVVAAGRGGRFERANEALRVIESSIGTPDGHKPGAASAQEIQEKKEAMENEIKELKTAVEALTATLAPVVAFVNESKASLIAGAKAEAQAEADSAAVTAALESYAEKVAAVDAEDFPEKVAESLKAAAKTGEDIAGRITEYKALGEAFKSQVEESGEPVTLGGRMSESGTGDAKTALPKGW